MDPHPTDPNVLFIHPPFNSFPNSSSAPDGLIYSLMAENPEWFLDPNDFLSPNNTNPNAIPYPPYLEPPRGWCPAKKKDLKERRAEGWPEGEEPRLRCTFCRRTYAGVNAKSMWRRHVFEKHKIPMSNRRDGNSDRPRGRSSGSKRLNHHFTKYFIRLSTEENKQVASAKNTDSRDGLISIIVTPQTVPDTSTHKSRFRSEKTEENAKRRDHPKQVREDSTPLTPQRPKRISSFSEDESDSDTQPQTLTSPLLPLSSDPPNVVGSEGTAVASPILSCPRPESPYNPLQTPSFRHSPPRPPSFQPWRFPSPSHPLHSNSCDLSLTVLARSQCTPLVKGGTTVTASPLPGIQSSPLSNVTAVATPASSTSFLKSGKKSYLFDQISSPLSIGASLTKRQRIISSPLPFTIHRTANGHHRHLSDSSDFWFMDERLPSKALPIESTPTDPFAIYESWPITGGATMMSPVRPPKRPIELESPIVRSGPLKSLTGDLESDEGVPPIEDVDDDLREFLLSSPAQEHYPVADSESSPPHKRRKIMTDGPIISFL